MALANQKLRALRDEDDTLRARIEVLDALEDDEVTDDQVDEYRAAVDRLTELKPLIEAEEQFEAKVEAARARVPEREPVEVERQGPDVFVRNQRSPFDDLDQIRSGYVAPADMRARAKTALEELPSYIDDAGRERANALVEGRGVGKESDRDNIARHMLLTGSQDYYRAFQKVLANPQLGAAALEPEEARALRTAMSLTDANGGYMVPYFLDPTIMLNNNGTINPFRDICRVVSITTEKWEGVTSAGVSAAYAAEATQVADNSPTFTGPTVTPERAHAWVFGSFEVMEDTSFAGQVSALFADAKSRLEGTKFAVGAGSGSNEPNGVVTAIVAADSSGSHIQASATTDTFAVADVYALEALAPARYRPQSVFLAANATMQKIRQFDTYGGSALWAQLGDGTPPLLLGHRAYESSDMDATITGSGENYLLAFFDPSCYAIVDRVGMRVMYEPLVKGANERPTGQAGWYAFWRNSADLVDTAGGRILNVT